MTEKNGKKEIVEKVIAEAGEGTLIIDEAVTKAKTLKILKSTNPDGKWRSAFRIYGTVTKREDGTRVVTKKVVTIPVVTPEVVI